MNEKKQHSRIGMRIMVGLLTLVMLISVCMPSLAVKANAATPADGLTISKTATARGDGTYDLELTLKGTVGTEETPTPMDLIIIIDRSRSMIEDPEGTVTRDRLAKAKQAAIALLDEVGGNKSIDLRFRIVDFAGSGHSKSTDDAVAAVKGYGYNVVNISDWYNSVSTSAKNYINAISVKKDIYTGQTFNGKANFWYNHHATNYEAVFRQVNTITTRSNAMKVVVFLTDGDPTVAWSTISGTTIDGHNNSEGYGTTYDTDTNITKCLNAAKDEINALTADRFYMVGIGEVGRLSTVSSWATNASYKKVMNSNTNNLLEDFTSIGATLNELFYKKVTITDTLSHKDNQLMVQTDPSTIGITVKDGDAVIAQSKPGEMTVTVSKTNRNDAATLTASYDASTGQLKLDFPSDYKLEPDYTYILSAVIEPTEKAYREYREASEQYSDTADAGTGTHAGVSNGGFFSNDKAVVTYDYADQTGLQTQYKMPVVQLTPGTLVVTKDITGLTDEEIEKLDLKFDIEITYPDDRNGKADETVTKQVKLSGMTKGADGIYSYTINGLSPNTQYTVTESSGEVDGYDMTTTVTNTSEDRIISGKIAKGTVGKGETVTVNYVNDYAVSVTDVTVEKQVTGNMGDLNKPFTFYAGLSDRADTMVGLEYVKYAKDENGVLTAGSKTEITAGNVDSNGIFTFTLKDDEYIIFSKVPLNATLEVTEDRGGYTLNRVDVTGISKESEFPTEIENGIRLLVTGSPKITFNNYYQVIVDTGVLLDTIPYVLILGVVVVGVVLLLRKRRNRDDV